MKTQIMKRVFALGLAVAVLFAMTMVMVAAVARRRSGVYDSI